MDIITDFSKILELKRYSLQTINSYSSQIRLAKSYFKDRSFKLITDKEFFDFIYYLVKTKNISASTQRQVVGSLKLFYKEIYNRKIPFENLQVSQRENKLPVVLSKNEVNKIL